MEIKNKIKQQDNYGGLHKLLVVPMSKLVEFPYIAEDCLFDPALFETLNPDFVANTIPIEFKKQTAATDEADAETDLGKICKQTVNCIVAKDYADLAPIFKTMRNERFLVLAWDKNLLGKVYGNITRDGEKQGCRLELKKATGDTKLNMLELIFYKDSSELAFIIKDNSYFDVGGGPELPIDID